MFQPKQQIARLLAAKKMGNPFGRTKPVGTGFGTTGPGLGTPPSSGLLSAPIPSANPPPINPPTIQPNLGIKPPFVPSGNPNQVMVNKVPSMNRIPANPEREAGVTKISRFPRLFKSTKL